PVDRLQPLRGDAEDRAPQHRSRDVERRHRPWVGEVDAHHDGRAVEPEQERDQQRQPRVDAEDREEGEPQADPEGEGGAVGRVLDVEQELDRPLEPAAHACWAGSRRARAAKWSWDFGRSRRIVSPKRRESPGGPSENCPTTLRVTLQTAASSRRASTRSGGTAMSIW